MVKMKCVKLWGTAQNEILGKIMWDGESNMFWIVLDSYACNVSVDDWISLCPHHCKTIHIKREHIF